MKKDPWTKVYESACADPRLGDGDLRVFIAVKLRARESGSCWESVEKIGKRAGGKKARAVQRSLAKLKKYSYLAEVYDPSRKTGRRLVSVEAPSETTPAPVANDAPPVSKTTPNLEHLIENREVDQPSASASSLSLRETTLSSDESRASDDGDGDVEKLRKRLEGISTPGLDGRTLNMRITALGKWMASTLIDSNSRANYCGVLHRVARGELSADHVVTAFGETFSRGVAGEVGDWGPYFFGAIANIRSDLAHEEVEANWPGG